MNIRTYEKLYFKGAAILTNRLIANLLDEMIVYGHRLVLSKFSEACPIVRYRNPKYL